MNRLTCAIVEDDRISLALIEGLAEKSGLLEVKKSLASSQEALLWLSENQVDLLFLDMEMPEISGLQLLRALSYKPEVIIISSNPNYAVEAFEFSVTDYLLKPIKDYARFLQAVNKVSAKQKPQKKETKDIDGNLFVRIDSLLLKLNLDDVFWIEASGDYIKIQTTEKNHIVYSTLKKIEEKLPPQKFVRVHRSFIINISKISNIDPNNLEINKKIIPISSTYKEELLDRIKVL